MKDVEQSAQQITLEPLHLMTGREKSAVDYTFVTEGFSEAICKSKHSPKMLSDLFIIDSFKFYLVCVVFELPAF